MELRHLRYFVAVAEEQNFSRAAARLHMAQPPLSQQIKDLEDELEVQLLIRDQRPIRLTEAGAELLEQARWLLSSLDTTLEKVKRIGRGQTGSIRVGFVGSAAYDILPEVFREFRLRYPDVQLSLLELRSLGQIEQLRHREIDIGFVRGDPSDSSFESKEVVEEPLVVALPEGHRLAVEEIIQLSSLAGEPLIGFPAATTALGGYLLQVCEEAGFRANIVQETIEVQTAISLVSAGMGLTLAPASQQKVGRTGVIYRPLAPPTPTTKLYAVFRRERRPAVLEAFLKVLDDVLRILKTKST